MTGPGDMTGLGDGPPAGAERLCLARLPRVPAQWHPSPDPRDLTLGIVHLGIGAFHRAHQAVYTQRAMALSGETSWASCGVTQRSASVAEALGPQDCLYSVLERRGDGVGTGVIGSVREVLVGHQQQEEVADRLSDPRTRVITLTVTEKGYRFDPATLRLRRDDPEILADAAGRPPRTVLGQLVTGLEARRRRGSPPVTVLCCDNLPSNGATLDRLVHEFCQLPGVAGAGPLSAWVADHVSFPNTMVDRIVPAATAEDRETALGLLGLEDRAVVVTEPFSQWVIEDRFVGPRPAWERAGATLVAEVGPYEEMKLRLLNGSHSALAYLGALAGFDYVAEAMGAPGFAGFVRDLMDLDVTPTLKVPADFDLEAYKKALLERFANTALRHRATQIAMDGSQKLPYRLLRTIASRLAAGGEPRHACLAVAAWMRYVSTRESSTGAALPLDDPLAERLVSAVASASSPAAVVSSLLGLTEIFPPELAGDSTFRALLTDALGALAGRGPAAVVASLG